MKQQEVKNGFAAGRSGRMQDLELDRLSTGRNVVVGFFSSFEKYRKYYNREVEHFKRLPVFGFARTTITLGQKYADFVSKK